MVKLYIFNKALWMVNETEKLYLHIFIASLIIFILIAIFFPIFPIINVVIYYSNNGWNASYSIQKIPLVQYALFTSASQGQGIYEANIKLVGSDNSNDTINSFNSIIFDRNFTITKGINTFAIDKLATSNEEVMVNISSGNFSKVMVLSG